MVAELAARAEGGGPHAGRRCWTSSRVAHGLHATDQLSVRVADLSLIGAADGPAARAARRPRSPG